ncbi:hypothetical protein [Spirobacillus cienkowskii]|uniref:DUF1573 domain-containing protein n=1 Tax=Spirobacillus cienkowskii TaxID=495820 RepID=A0A369KQ09_9BACT|nr:MAG: hypothetical protein DCC88_10145 [Spirobacillus cienkowskii]
MKKIKKILILMLICFWISSFTIQSKETETVNIRLGKCKFIPIKKVLEIEIENSNILAIQRDNLNNKICLKAKNIGTSKVRMLLYNGVGTVNWKVMVFEKIPSSKQKRPSKLQKQDFYYRKSIL